MCGRFTLKSPGRVRFDGRSPRLLETKPRYNIAPSQEVLVITQSDDLQDLSSFIWGLVPSWSKEPRGFINARAETLEEKPSFSESFLKRRCLIPADGFYEWKRNGKTRQPYYFQMSDEAPFAFAGIWDEWRKDGVSIASCSIVTTAPNELLETIHDRMPVILAPAVQEAWLRHGAAPAELRAILKPFPASGMKSHPVSQEVNYAQAEDERLVEPVELIQAGTNLSLF
jgi:putative SOS response-associated peptidase YedK